VWPPRHTSQLEITVNIAHKGCAVACIVCPQDKLSKTYNLYPENKLIRDLSFDTFKTAIDKVPLTTRIDFSGYTEPYLNKDCSKMIKYVHDRGHTVSVYTTLVGATESDVDLLLDICQHPTRPFSAFDQENPLCIHLPDEGGVMPVKITKKYKRVLKYLITKAQSLGLGLGTHIRMMTMDKNGKLSKEILDVFPVDKIPFQFKAISRASNLDDEGVKRKAPTMTNYEGGVGMKTGKIICKSNSLHNNVLIPNGDVHLCCMDYGLEAKVGNLLENDYDYLHNGEGMKYITDRMADDSLDGDIICRRCENADYEFNEDFVMKTIDMQDTLNYLYEKLDSESKVYYSRFGDGDFEIMKGKREMMHRYSPELAEELRESFGILDDNYIRGTMFNEPTYNGRELVHQSPDNFKDLFGFIQNNYENFNDFILYSHVLLTYIFIHEQDIFLDFMNNFIRPKRKLFIGSIKKSSIEKLVGEVHYHVETPSRDAYYNIDEWWPKVLECVDDVDLVLPAAGMAGRVVQKRLWKLDKNVHSIELGSMVDTVDDLNTRSWMVNKKEIIDRILI
tara:strand:- start:560 stop:2242 length:1683 start_codon:yes stop_codon:yes gene_type:complete